MTDIKLTIVVETEFMGRQIRVYRSDSLAAGSTYACFDGDRMVQKDLPGEAVMGWLANMMMNAK